MRASLKPRSIYDLFAVVGCLAALTTGSAYAANTVFSSDIVDGEVKNVDLANNSVGTYKIITGTIIGPDLHADAVDGSKILDGAIAAADLGPGSVTLGKVGANSISSSAILTDAVKGSEIADNQIDTGEIIDDSLTTADIAGTDVNGGKISFVAGSVANGRCEDHAVATGGATTGEAAVITTQGALPQGILLYANRVPSNGSVTMKICNFTGGTMPAINNLSIRTITFG